MKYGTYTTIDCPTKKDCEITIRKESYDWLQSEFAKIGGEVRMISNPHDFGPYPSFEIDYPHEEWTFLGENDIDDESIEMLKKKDKWIEQANEIERRYGKKFEKYL